jgi:hypothetical protein
MGATVFLYVLFTSPKVSIVRGTYVVPSPDKKEIAKIVDLSTATMRAVAVLGATMLVSIALKDTKGTRTRSAMDKEPILAEYTRESERQLVKRGALDRILRFLKDFF